MPSIMDLARNHPLTVSAGVTLTRAGAVIATGARIDTPAAEDLGGSGDLCLEWGGIIDRSSSGNRIILDGATLGGAGVLSVYGFSVESSGRVMGGFVGLGKTLRSQSDVCDGQFHRLCLERDGTIGRLMVDGVVVDQAAALPGSLSIVGQNGGRFTAGAPFYYPSGGFSGTMGYVRVTTAARYRGSYAAGALAYGSAADPQWSATSLLVLLSEPPIGLHDDLLRRLLPPQSMDRLGPNLTAELRAYSAALDAASDAAAGVLAESDPRTTLALLPDWERNYGQEPSGELDVRRAALLAQILASGGQSRDYYIALAAALGYTATIEEYALHTVMSPVTFPLYGLAWRFVWKVRARASAGAVSHAAFESLINKLKPAHTRVVFEYY